MITGRGWKLLCVVTALGFAAQAQAQFTKCITNFEVSEGYDPGDEVIWQEPLFSGSTDGIIGGTDQGGIPISNSQVVDWFGLPSNSYEISFPWGDPTDTTTTGVRCTTFQAENLTRPSLHLGGKIRFKMAVTAFAYGGTQFPIGAQITDGSASILMCLGVTESGNDLNQGASDSGGDLEVIYLPGSEVIPTPDSEGLIGFPAGGKRFAATTLAWPPPAGAFQTVEFDLTNLAAVRGIANDGDGVDTAGDGVLDATLSAGGDGVNRGYLESIIFTKDPADTTSQYFFIYIDEVEFEAPVADPSVAPPSVVPPIFSTDTSVTVNTLQDACTGADVDSVELFVNAVSQGTAVPSGGSVTFNSLTLSAGDVVTATQTLNSVTSALSSPVTVFEPGVVFADNFDSYNSQAELNQVWSNSINFPDPPNARLNLEQGNAASCENIIVENNPSGADGARAYRLIGSVNGTDAEPLRVTWNFQHRGASSFGSRFRFEMARYAGDSFSTSLGARLEGTTGIILENGPGSVPFPQTLDEYNILLIDDTPTNGFFAGNQGNVANTGVLRGDNEWHQMQIEVLSSTINYYIDGALANPVDTNGIPLWPGGVPRPNTDPYNFLVIGQGFSNNGPAMLIDNVSVTLGAVALPFGDPVPVESPTVSGSYVPGDTQVTIVDVDSNATEVAVIVDGVEVATTNGVGVFTDNTAVVTVPALSGDDLIQATQTVEVAAVPTESCLSAGVVVASPAPTVESPLIPGQTTVDVSDINEGLATGVTVYIDEGGGSQTAIGSVSNPLTDPVTVNVTTLGVGQVIVATQTIGGTESDNSAGVTVGVPAPTVLPPLLIGDIGVTVTDVLASADEVTVLVNGSTAGFLDVSASSAATVIVPVAPALAANDSVTATQTIFGATGPESLAVEVSLPICLVAFEDDFDTDTSADWNVNIIDEAGDDDAAATFNFDYGTVAGIPPSPNGSGSTFGLKLEANNFVDATVTENAAVTVSPVGQSFDTNGYRLVFDMWINVNLTLSGSTEFMTMGVGYDDVTNNLMAPNGSTTDADFGDGAWFALSGETGAGQDIRAYKNTTVQSPSSGQFAAGTDVTAHFADGNALYTDLFGIPTPPDDQVTLFPTQTNNAAPEGSAGLAWHAVDITVLRNKARWSVADTTFVTLDNSVTQSIDLSGNVSIGYSDVFNSVTDVPAMAFGLADNVRVLVNHTPGTNGDYDGDGDVDLVDAEYLVDCLGGVATIPAPSTGSTCSGICLSVFDFDSDLDVDLADYAEFQKAFSP